ncbi:MAG: SAM-dependent methyltransferase [candidate division KSB1 bacterium]|nr:SAM-dependent methyltransferase [candidate division KSB1 bacterium]MDZ7275658.1 SAM-dependent methyltransferase [candidate division KSB1 bacterium]MDZ7284651.1 SAM-dependent methyltransferase [candidate division KSB1 bacterium]MDZ7297930.1 SAM-dependent methyltransferase [candidate division KSB1 bacterium]MDZ7307105.1 SAM-dependent methyltransferase [candidate division KSB1 bacterium]
MRPEPVTLDELSAHFAEALKLVSAVTDPLPLRNHLLAVILLKRLHDQFQDRYDSLIARERSQGSSEAEAVAVAEDPDEHPIFVPREARWPVLLGTPGHSLAALARACAALAARNPGALAGVLDRLSFETLDTGLGAAAADELWHRLLHHLSKISLADQNLLTDEVFAGAIDRLLEDFIQKAGRKAGDFASPHSVMQLLAELLQPADGMRLCDPVCGAARGLLACRAYVARAGGQLQNLSLHGEELDPETWVLGRLNLLLHGVTDFQLELGDTLSRPLLAADGSLLTCDRLIAHPPFSIANWPRHIASNDPWQRFQAGVPPEKRGDLAFAQHALAALTPTGRAALIMPHGVLFRAGLEQNIRRGWLQPDCDVIEAVIGLPSGLGYGASLAFAILLLRPNKPQARRGRVLFIDATAHLEPESPEQGLQDTDILKIVATYRTFGEAAQMPAALEEIIAEWLRHCDTAHHAARNRWPEGSRAREKIDAQFHLRRQALQQAAERARLWLAHNPALAGFAATATLADIETAHHCNLNFTRYVSGRRYQPAFDFTTEWQALRELEAQRNQAEGDMDRLLAEWGSDRA